MLFSCLIPVAHFPQRIVWLLNAISFSGSARSTKSYGAGQVPKKRGLIITTIPIAIVAFGPGLSMALAFSRFVQNNLFVEPSGGGKNSYRPR